MPREMFERELQRLQDAMLAMASMVEHALLESVEALKRRDLEGSRRLIEQDRAINKRRFETEADCLVAIATQQPMASDLRILAAILDIVSELERIGDYAKGIARINLMIGEPMLIKLPPGISDMAARARSMLHRALDAFVHRDVDLARAIPLEDDEVDRLYDQVYRDLITHVVANIEAMDQASHLLWVAHNLERAADRVTNVCERVIFTVTGEMAELGRNTSGVESVN